MRGGKDFTSEVFPCLVKELGDFEAKKKFCPTGRSCEFFDILNTGRGLREASKDHLAQFFIDGVSLIEEIKHDLLSRRDPLQCCDEGDDQGDESCQPINLWYL